MQKIKQRVGAAFWTLPSKPDLSGRAHLLCYQMGQSCFNSSGIKPGESSGAERKACGLYLSEETVSLKPLLQGHWLGQALIAWDAGGRGLLQMSDPALQLLKGKWTRAVWGAKVTPGLTSGGTEMPSPLEVTWGQAYSLDTWIPPASHETDPLPLTPPMDVNSWGRFLTAKFGNGNLCDSMDSSSSQV